MKIYALCHWDLKGPVPFRFFLTEAEAETSMEKYLEKYNSIGDENVCIEQFGLCSIPSSNSKVLEAFQQALEALEYISSSPGAHTMNKTNVASSALKKIKEITSNA